MALDLDGIPGAPHRDLAERNRQLIAERLQWPAGALDAVRAVEAACPGWSVSWHDDWAVPGFERAAGFYAWRTEDKDPGHTAYGADGPRWVPRPEVYGVTADQLAHALNGALP